MLLVNGPTPSPSSVCLPATVGLGAVLQQTPLAVIADPPSEVTFPPLDAVVAVILETEVVVIVGTNALVVKLISLP